MAKTFKKELWLEAAKAQIGNSALTQKDIDHAYNTWVADYDGKTADEIAADDGMELNENWFE